MARSSTRLILLICACSMFLLSAAAAQELKAASEAMVYTAASPASEDQAADDVLDDTSSALLPATAQDIGLLDDAVGDVVDMQPVQPFIQVSQSLQRAAHKKGKCIFKNKIVDCGSQHTTHSGGSR